MFKIKKFVSENKKELFQLGIMAAVIVIPMFQGSGICEAAKTGNVNMPWKTGTETLMDEISGPLPKIAGVISVAATGMMMAFGEMQGMAKKGVQVVFGLGTAISSASLVGTLTGAKDSAEIVAGLMF